MHGVVILVVIVTVSSVRSLHPQPKRDNSRTREGSPVRNDFNPNPFGPTKTKRGKRPERIGNIDVNYIRTIGADVGLRGLSQAIDNTKDTTDKTNGIRPYLSSTGELPKVQANNRDYGRFGKHTSFVGTYSKGFDLQDGSNNADRFSKVGSQVPPGADRKRTRMTSVYQNNYDPNQAFLSNFVNTFMSGDLGNGMKMLNDMKLSKVDNSKRYTGVGTNGHRIVDKASDTFPNINFGQDVNDFNHQPPFSESSYASNYQLRTQPGRDSWESTMSKTFMKNFDHNTASDGKRTYQTQNTENTGMQRNPSNKPKSNNFGRDDKYDPWRPDFGIPARKTSANDKSTVDYNVPDSKTIDLTKPDFGRPDKPTMKENLNIKTTVDSGISDTSKQRFGVLASFDNTGNDSKSAIDLGRPQPPGLPKSTDMLNTKNKIDHFGALGLSETDFGRPDKQTSKSKGYAKQAEFVKSSKTGSRSGTKDLSVSRTPITKSDKPTHFRNPDPLPSSFGRQDRPEHSKSKFDGLNKDSTFTLVSSRTEQHGYTKTLDISTANRKEVDYSRLDLSKPDFGRPSKYSKNSSRAKINDESVQQIRPTTHNKQTGTGTPDITKPDFGRPDRQYMSDYPRRKIKRPLKNSKPSIDFGQTDYTKPTVNSIANKTQDHRGRHDITIPNFGRPDKQSPTHTVQPKPTKDLKSKINTKNSWIQDLSEQSILQTEANAWNNVGTRDLSKPDRRDRNTENGGKSTLDLGIPDLPNIQRPLDINNKRTEYRKVDISKYGFGRLDTQHSTAAGYSKPFGSQDRNDMTDKRMNNKQSPIDFGRPSRNELTKPIDKSATNSSRLNYDRRKQPNPSFGQPDKQTPLRDVKEKSIKAIESSYNIRRLQTQDVSVHGIQSTVNDKLNDPGTPSLSIPDFGRPDRRDNSRRKVPKPLKKRKPSTEFGRPDRQDIKTSKVKSTGNLKQVDQRGYHLSKLKSGKSDFGRPDKQNPNKIVHKKSYKVAKSTRHRSKSQIQDVPVQSILSDGTDPLNDARTRYPSSPDFGRPDRPDRSKNTIGRTEKVSKSFIDVGISDPLDLKRPIDRLDINDKRNAYGNVDISKSDFGRPDKVVSKRTRYNNQKNVKLSNDNSRSVNRDLLLLRTLITLAGKRKDSETPDYSKPEFGRSDRNDISKSNVDKQTNNKQLILKPTNQLTANRRGLVDDTPKQPKPSFGRPYKQTSKQNIYGKSIETTKSSNNVRRLKLQDVVVHGIQSSVNDKLNDPGTPTLSTADFGRPDRTDNSKGKVSKPLKKRKLSTEFGRPDRQHLSILSAGTQTLNDAGTRAPSKPDFGRPDRPDRSRNMKGRTNNVNKSVIDFGVPNPPNIKGPSDRLDMNDKGNAYGNADVSKPDFGRPDKVPSTSTRYKNKTNKVMLTKGSSRSVNHNLLLLRTMLTLAGKRKDIETPDVPRPEFGRPDRTDFSKGNVDKRMNNKESTIDKSTPTSGRLSYDTHKPSFGRPEKPNLKRNVYRKTKKTTKSSNNNKRLKTQDLPVHAIQSTVNDKPNDPGTSSLSIPDFGRPDRTNNAKTVPKPLRIRKPATEFGRPDRQDLTQSKVKATGNKEQVDQSWLDLSKPDFGRPDKQNPNQIVYNKSSKVVKSTSLKGKSQIQDLSLHRILSDGTDPWNNARTRDPSKPDFGRPDRPDRSKKRPINRLDINDKPNAYGNVDIPVSKSNFVKSEKPPTKGTGYNNPTRNVKLSNNNSRSVNHDLLLLRTMLTLAGKRKDIETPDVPRPEFGRPDRTDFSKGNVDKRMNNKESTIDKSTPTSGRLSYDTHKPSFGRPEKPNLKRNVYRKTKKTTKSSNNNKRLKTQDLPVHAIQSTVNDKPNDPGMSSLSIPDFGRPDRTNNAKTVPKPLIIRKPATEFGRPDRQDLTKSKVKATGNKEQVDQSWLDLSKPDFGRPDKQNPNQIVYNKSSKVVKSTSLKGKSQIQDLSVHRILSDGTDPWNNARTRDPSKPDFGRPDRPDRSKKRQINRLGINDKPNAYGNGDIPVSKSNFVKSEKPPTKGTQYNNPTRNVKLSNNNSRSVNRDLFLLSTLLTLAGTQKDREIPDFSQPEFGRPDRKDPSKGNVHERMDNKQSTIDFGRPSRQDLTKRMDQSTAKSSPRGYDIPKQPKPSFGRPDKQIPKRNAYEKSTKTTKSSNNIRKFKSQDLSIHDIQSVVHNKPNDPRTSSLSTADFGRPDMTDNSRRNEPKPFKKGKPSTEFGRDDRQHLTISRDKSTGLKAQANQSWRDLSKTDFGRPDKQTPNQIVYNKSSKFVKSTRYTSKSQTQDVPVHSILSDGTNPLNDPRPRNPSKLDFGRPDRPDRSKNTIGRTENDSRSIIDFGISDPQVLKRPIDRLDVNDKLNAFGKFDMSKSDFVRSEKLPTQGTGYNDPTRNVKLSNDNSRSVNHNLLLLSTILTLAGKRKDHKTPDFSKHEFGRPDKNDKRMENKQSTIDFGRPSKQDLTKPIDQSTANSSPLVYDTPKQPKPSFGRPDKQAPKRNIYGKSIKNTKSSDNIRKLNLEDVSVHDIQSTVTDKVSGSRTSSVSTPDFGRPDRTANSRRKILKPLKKRKPSTEFGRPDRQQLNALSAGTDPRNDTRNIQTNTRKRDPPKPDFGRPDRPDRSKNKIGTNKYVSKSVSDFGIPDPQNLRRPNGVLDINDKRSASGELDISKSDFGRRDKLPSTGYNNWAKNVKNDNSRSVNQDLLLLSAILTMAGKRKDIETPDFSKPEFSRPDRLDVSKSEIGTRMNNKQSTTDFGRPSQQDLARPIRKSLANNSRLGYDTPEPSFGRPDKHTPKPNVNRKSIKTTKSSNKIRRLKTQDLSLHNIQLNVNDKVNDPGTSSLSTPDFGRPDQTDNSRTTASKPLQQRKPSTGFGRPDRPDLAKSKGRSTGNKDQVYQSTRDLTKPHFGRPKKQTPNQVVDEKSFQIVKSTNHKSNYQIQDLSVNSILSFDTDIWNQTRDPPKLDFGRPDRPDSSRNTKGTTKNVSKSFIDFGLPGPQNLKRPIDRIDINDKRSDYRKVDVSKPDFGRSDNLPSTGTGYSNPTNNVILSNDNSRSINHDLLLLSSILTVARKQKDIEVPDFSKPELRRPQRLDISNNNADKRMDNKQLTIDYGPHDRQDLTKPIDKSAAKSNQLGYDRFKQPKTTFGRPDKQTPIRNGYGKSIKTTKSSNNIRKLKLQDVTVHDFQSTANDKLNDPGTSSLLSPDFGRPDRTDTLRKVYKPLKTRKPSTDFGRPDKQAIAHSKDLSTRNRGQIDQSTRDLSKPDFGRPDKNNPNQNINNKPAKVVKSTNHINKSQVQDLSMHSIFSARTDKADNTKTWDLSKPDFGRPDSPDRSRNMLGISKTVSKSIIDFGTPDVQNLKTTIISDMNSNRNDYGMVDISKQDFGIPDQQAFTGTGYNKQNDVTQLPYDNSKSVNHDLLLLSTILTMAGKRKAIATPDVSKQDFSRHALPKSSVNKLVKKKQSAIDFGRPGRADLTTPSANSIASRSRLDYAMSKTHKPSVERSDKQTPIRNVYVESTNIAKSSDTRRLTTQDLSQQNIRSTVNNNFNDALSTPDFGRPDRSDNSKKDINRPLNNRITATDFGQTDIHYQIQGNDKQTQKKTKVDYGTPDYSKSDFGRPAKQSSKGNVYRKLKQNDKFTGSIRKPQIPDLSVQSIHQRVTDKINEFGTHDLSIPDFGIPNIPDHSRNINQQTKDPSKATHDFGRMDEQPITGFRNKGQNKVIKSSRNKNMFENRKLSLLKTLYNIVGKQKDVERPALSKSDFGRPERRDHSTTFINQMNDAKSVKDFNRSSRQGIAKSIDKSITNRKRVDYGTHKPEFVRPDTQTPERNVYDKFTKVAKSSNDRRRSKIHDLSVQDIISTTADKITGAGTPDLSKPDFGKPARPDYSRRMTPKPLSYRESSTHFGRPGVQDLTNSKDKSTAKKQQVDYGTPNLSNSEFGRPDQLTPKRNVYHKSSKGATSTNNLRNQKRQNVYVYSKQNDGLIINALKKLNLAKGIKPSDNAYDFGTPIINVQAAPILQSKSQAISKKSGWSNSEIIDRKKENYDITGKPADLRVDFDFGRLDKPDTHGRKPYKSTQSVQSNSQLGMSADTISTKFQVEKSSSKPTKGAPSTNTFDKSVQTPGKFISLQNADISQPVINRQELPILRANRQELPILSTTYDSQTNYDARNKQDNIQTVGFKNSDRLTQNTGASGQIDHSKDVFTEKSQSAVPLKNNLAVNRVNGNENVLRALRVMYHERQKASNKNYVAKTQNARGQSEKVRSFNPDSTRISNKELQDIPVLQTNENNINLQTARVETIQKSRPMVPVHNHVADQSTTLQSMLPTDTVDIPNISGKSFNVISETPKQINTDAGMPNNIDRRPVDSNVQPYVSQKGNTASTIGGSTYTSEASGRYENQFIGGNTGVEPQLQETQRANPPRTNSNEQQKTANGKRTNCTVIAPICGDDEFTYLSECFLPPNIKKACDGFCPCPAPGEPSGPTTLLVGGKPSSKTVVSIPSAQPIQSASAKSTRTNPSGQRSPDIPMFASGNLDKQAVPSNRQSTSEQVPRRIGGLPKTSFRATQTSQSSEGSSGGVTWSKGAPSPASQASFKFVSDNFCEFKCRGKKLNPVCTTLGITRDNECIQKCREEKAACDGACPCRNERLEEGLAALQTMTNNNGAAASNMNTLQLLGNDENTGLDPPDTDGNDNRDPGIKS